jgi:hypothetical protein
LYARHPAAVVRCRALGRAWRSGGYFGGMQDPAFSHPGDPRHPWRPKLSQVHDSDPQDTSPDFEQVIQEALDSCRPIFANVSPTSRS